MKTVDRMKQLIERIADPKLNNGMPLNEANGPTFADYWAQEKGNAKEKLWGYIEKARQQNPDLYKNITKRHVDFLIEVFGTKFGPQMDPNAALNILKNPDRFVSKVNDYFSKTKENEEPTGLTALGKEAKAENLDPAFLPAMLHSDLTILRKAFVNNFKTFVKNRDKWRAKLEKDNLTGLKVSYYIPNSGKEALSYTAIGKAKVLIDFSFMDTKGEKLLEKLAGDLPEMEKNKNVGIAEDDQSNQGPNNSNVQPEQQPNEEQANQSVFDLATLKETLKGFVLIQSDNTKHNMIMGKNNIVPSNIIIKNGRKKFEDLINADPNAKIWFNTPIFKFETGKLFINGFESGKTEGIMKALFKAATKGDIYGKFAQNRLEDLGFKFSDYNIAGREAGSKDEKESYTNVPFTGATPSITRFLENAVESKEKIAKKLGNGYALKIIRGVIDIKVKPNTQVIEKIIINKTKFEKHFSLNAIEIKQQLLKDINKTQIEDKPTTYEII